MFTVVLFIIFQLYTFSLSTLYICSSGQNIADDHGTLAAQWHCWETVVPVILGWLLSLPGFFLSSPEVLINNYREDHSPFCRFANFPWALVPTLQPLFWTHCLNWPWLALLGWFINLKYTKLLGVLYRIFVYLTFLCCLILLGVIFILGMIFLVKLSLWRERLTHWEATN